MLLGAQVELLPLQLRYILTIVISSSFGVQILVEVVLEVLTCRARMAADEASKNRYFLLRYESVICILYLHEFTSEDAAYLRICMTSAYR